MLQFRLSAFLLFTFITSVFVALNIATYKEHESVASTMTQILPAVSNPGYGWPWQCVDVGTVLKRQEMSQEKLEESPVPVVTLGRTYRFRTPQFLWNSLVLFSMLLISHIGFKIRMKESEQ